MSLIPRPIRFSDRVSPLPALLFAAVCLLFLLAAAVWALGARTPYTPAGYVGYLTKGALFGKARFYGIQRGPTSPGRTWLLEVTNISITPYTYTENFTGDDGNSAAHVATRQSCSTTNGGGGSLNPPPVRTV